ncbi:hypothetical protein N9503_04050 [Candidatus Pelagibacter sp.]|nr:hypothetical protein [Candidatus Pelagibacter sp.]
MKKKYHFFGLIPAKKKSVRLKNKNLLKLKNKTLIEIAINESLNSKLINDTYVSTNSKKILKLSLKAHAKVILRSNKYSSDKAPSSHVIMDFINQLKLRQKPNSYVVYLQPTSPFRNHFHIDKAIRSFIKSKKKTLISLKLSNKSILKNYYIKNKKIIPIYLNGVTTNFENLPEVYAPNGSIFIFKANDFLKKKSLIFENFHPFFMDDNSSIDIDNNADYLYAKSLIK